MLSGSIDGHLGRIKARMVANKIRPEFFSGNGDEPERKLCFAVIEKAVLDLFTGYKNAEFYLSSEMPHAAMCGVSSSWIRRVITVIDKSVYLDAEGSPQVLS